MGEKISWRGLGSSKSYYSFVKSIVYLNSKHQKWMHYDVWLEDLTNKQRITKWARLIEKRKWRIEKCFKF